MTDRLEGCRTKIKRAKKHIRDLNTTAQAFFDTKPYMVGTKRNPMTRQLIYYVLSVQDTDPIFPVITGDALQNLRSALDHLAYQLVDVGTGGKGPFDHVYFPIFENAAKYKTGKIGYVKGMRQDAIDAIDAIEPYGGGKADTLWRLHSLGIIDKHRLLITVGSSLRGVGITAHLQRELERMWPKDSVPVLPELFLNPADKLCPLKVGDELFVSLPDAEVNEKIKFTFGIALNEPQIAEAEPLIETVQQMAHLVDNLVSGFEHLLK